MEQEFLREAEHRVQESGFRDLDAGYMIQDTGCRIQANANWCLTTAFTQAEACDYNP
jgi:hypothetical protein